MLLEASPPQAKVDEISSDGSECEEAIPNATRHSPQVARTLSGFGTPVPRLHGPPAFSIAV